KRPFQGRTSFIASQARVWFIWNDCGAGAHHQHSTCQKGTIEHLHQILLVNILGLHRPILSDFFLQLWRQTTLTILRELHTQAVGRYSRRGAREGASPLRPRLRPAERRKSARCDAQTGSCTSEASARSRAASRRSVAEQPLSSVQVHPCCIRPGTTLRSHGAATDLRQKVPPGCHC